RNFMGSPHSLVESNGAAVKAVVAIVLRNFIPLTIQNKCAMSDAVAIATYNRAKVCLRVTQIAVKGVISQDHVGDFAVAIRNIQRDNASAIGHDARRQVAIVQREDYNPCSVRHTSEH